MTIKDPPNLDPFEENNPWPKKDLRLAAEKFMDEHPEVYALFVRFALEMLVVNEMFGINLLRERVRWEVKRFWKQDDRGFKVNNNHSPYIARRLIEDHPGLEPLLRCRKTYW